VTTCAACGYSVQRCKRRVMHKCCPDCKCDLKPHCSPVRQLNLALQLTLDLEPLLRGELLAAMAAVLARPEVPELDSSGVSDLPEFLWPKEGPAVVHYPLGGTGPRVEHPPCIVCDGCQWGVDAVTGWPIAAAGREPRITCNGCFRLTARHNWDASARRCRECQKLAGEWVSVSAEVNREGVIPETRPERITETGSLPA